MQIKLNGKTGYDHYALVDDNVPEYILSKKWFEDAYGYVVTSGTHKLKLHRVVMSAQKGQVVDHINRNKLDNRSINLRIVSAEVNSWNKGGFAIGIRYRPKRSRSKPYEAYGSVKHKYKYLGDFKTYEEAMDARLKFLQPRIDSLVC